MEKQVIRLIQLSDMHIFGDENSKLLGVNTRESFQAILNLVKQEYDKIDAFILSGDLSQDGSAIAYQHIAEVLNPFATPIYWVPGNHDDANVMSQVYPLHLVRNEKHILFNQWQIILLNSQKPGAVEGYLDDEQLDYLQQCLQNYPKHRALIFFHHHPLSVGCDWLEPIGLTNAKDFWSIIEKYSQVKSVFFGHVHQLFEAQVKNIPCFSIPSTCFQFKPKQEKFALEKIPPGLRKINLYVDGRLTTEVKRAAHYIGDFDEKAQGY